jgi:hypothetical protein
MYHRLLLLLRLQSQKSEYPPRHLLRRLKLPNQTKVKNTYSSFSTTLKNDY